MKKINPENISNVGGSVRDEAISRNNNAEILTPKDLDYLVVNQTEQDMLDAGYEKVGADFPVFLHPETKDEYALARIERKNGKGYHGFDIITEGVSVKSDLGRRDFTMNAMSKQNGIVYDPFGGLKDIENKTIRHVYDPADPEKEAFSEDPVRILRAARFAARYSDFTIAPETIELMKKMVLNGEIDNLQPDRIWLEIEKTLKEKEPSIFFKVLDEIGALDIILPELSNLKDKPQGEYYHFEGDAYVHTLMALDASKKVSEDTIIAFAVLLHDIGKGFTEQKLLGVGKHHGHDEIDKYFEYTEEQKTLFNTDDLGTNLIKCLDNIEKRFNVPNKYIKIALLGIKTHQQIHNFSKMGSKGITKFLKDFSHKTDRETLDLLTDVAKADSFGKLMLVTTVPDYEHNVVEVVQRGKNTLYVIEDLVYLQKDLVLEYYDFALTLNVKTLGVNTDKFIGKTGEAIGDIIYGQKVIAVKKYIENRKDKPLKDKATNIKKEI
jgi:tRNA nucleotidyltransferase (CCA-adding enzyme)